MSFEFLQLIELSNERITVHFHIFVLFSFLQNAVQFIIFIWKIHVFNLPKIKASFLPPSSSFYLLFESLLILPLSFARRLGEVINKSNLLIRQQVKQIRVETMKTDRKVWSSLLLSCCFLTVVLNNNPKGKGKIYEL